MPPINNTTQPPLGNERCLTIRKWNLQKAAVWWDTRTQTYTHKYILLHKALLVTLRSSTGRLENLTMQSSGHYLRLEQERNLASFLWSLLFSQLDAKILAWRHLNSWEEWCQAHKKIHGKLENFWDTTISRSINKAQSVEIERREGGREGRHMAQLWSHSFEHLHPLSEHLDLSQSSPFHYSFLLMQTMGGSRWWLVPATHGRDLAWVSDSMLSLVKRAFRGVNQRIGDLSFLCT